MLKFDKFQWLLLAVYTGAICLEAVWKTRAGLSYGILLKVWYHMKFMEGYKILISLLYLSDFKMYKICYNGLHIDLHL